MPHIIQQNLAAEIEWILSLKFPKTQNFHMPTVINCLNIMLLLFTTFRYCPDYIFSRNTAHLMISQKNVTWAVSQLKLYLLMVITSFGMLVMKENSFFHSDLKVVLVVVPASLERFTFFLIGLIDLDDSAIFIFFVVVFWVFFKRFMYV